MLLLLVAMGISASPAAAADDDAAVRPWAVAGSRSVVQEPLQITPIEDSYVAEAAPEANYGKREYANATSGEYKAYLKFDTLSELPPNTRVAEASLALFTNEIDLETPGVVVRPVANAWTETTVRDSNRPEPGRQIRGDSENRVADGDPFLAGQSEEAPEAGSWVSIPIDPETVNTGGLTSYQVTYTDPFSRFQFQTREGQNPPRLVLTLTSSSNAVAQLTPESDTYIDFAKPRINYGTETTATAAYAILRSFIRFDAPPVPEDWRLVHASLRLHTDADSDLAAGVEVHPASNDWSETDLVPDNRPAHQSEVIGVSGQPERGEWLTIPLTDLESVNAAGPTSLEIRHQVRDNKYIFSTREGENPPQLNLLYAGPDHRGDGSRPRSRIPTPISTSRWLPTVPTQQLQPMAMRRARSSSSRPRTSQRERRSSSHGSCCTRPRCAQTRAGSKSARQIPRGMRRACPLRPNPRCRPR